NPDRTLATLPLLSEHERRQLFRDWNGTEVPFFDAARFVHELVESQARQSADAIAVTAGDQYLTYRELNHRANQLAHYLRLLGVGPDVPVGLLVERSLSQMVGVLGVMKAGGAYVPLDSTHPAERLAFILADTRAPVVLTTSHLIGRLTRSQ